MEIDKIIKNRKTQKVLANEPWGLHEDEEGLHKTINELLDLAAFAPFHKKCDETHSSKAELNSCLPWRFYVLDSSNCRLLFDYIKREAIKAGKISNMLAAADALLICTWLPDSIKNSGENEETTYEGNIKNMEHIAAASAAIQNVLIGATARNIPNYWSSGGQLRMSQLRNHLNISLKEIVLGAVFLFPENLDRPDTIVKPGQLREQGKEKNSWIKWIQLNKGT